MEKIEIISSIETPLEKEKVRLNKNINAITKVYAIAKYLKEQNRIDDDLWYSILELIDEKRNELYYENEIGYFNSNNRKL